MASDNWLDLGLTGEEEEKVQEGARLYKETYVDTIDNVFKIAEAIEILRNHNYGTGAQGSFGAALVQYGFTTRDGLYPIDKSIRSNFKELRDHEQEVRAWWATVPEQKKRDWLSARAVYRHWKADTKPPGERRKTGQRGSVARSEGKTAAEIEAIAAQALKPAAERLEAKEAEEAEAEARTLEQREQPADARKLEAANEEIEILQRELAARDARLDELEKKADARLVAAQAIETVRHEPTPELATALELERAMDIVAAFLLNTEELDEQRMVVIERLHAMAGTPDEEAKTRGKRKPKVRRLVWEKIDRGGILKAKTDAGEYFIGKQPAGYHVSYESTWDEMPNPIPTIEMAKKFAQAHYAKGL